MKAFTKNKLVLASLGAMLLLSAKTIEKNKLPNENSTEIRKSYPAFSWDKVPVAFHFRKANEYLTDKEIEFVAKHSNFTVLEKAHAMRQAKSAEEAIHTEAARLKKANPNMKVVFYWNAFLDYPQYKAHKEYAQHPEWWLYKQDGELDLKNDRMMRYDLSNPEFRSWYANVAKKACSDPNIDGIFMDAFNQVTAKRNVKLWGEEKAQAIQNGLKQLIAETRSAIGEDKMIVYNGIRSTNNWSAGNDYPEHTDAIMIEHFGHFASRSKENMLKDILEMQKAGKTGKIVVFKAWPGFAWIDKEEMKMAESKKRKMAQEHLLFNLASFLVGAQEHSYFIYNWGYLLQHGSLNWYPEFEKPLGKPLADAKIEGYKLSRSFAHADVLVDLEAKEASIKWH